ncbi:MAG: FMN-binding negative transcriptional regulator [Brevirhabdus sp.]
MHMNPAFRKTPDQVNLDFARERGFGTLALSATDGPLLSHVPFRLTDDNAYAEFHLMRSNPILRALDSPHPGVIAVSGPDSYISPDWYGDPQQVPTWNYVAVHLRGTAEILPPEDLGPLLDRLSTDFETRLAPKPPWTRAKMDPDGLAKMMRMIVPCRMSVAKVDGTWKLNQNKSDALRLAAADHVEGYGIGQEVGLISALMRDPSPKE